jgi:hypothetical protein
MAEDKESGLAQSHESNAWFEAIGSRGFASLGAALGLAFSLVLVWATAPSLPAAPSRPKTSPVVQAEKPPSEEVKASVTAKQALLASPLPLVSAPRPHTSLVVSHPSSTVPTSASAPLLSTPPAEQSGPGDSTSKSTPSTPEYGRSSESSASPSGSRGGTDHVRGYYRKNGTYVQPYTRGSPRRR